MYNLWKNSPADTRNASFVSSFAISKETSEEPLSKTEFGWWMRGFWVMRAGGNITSGKNLPADTRNASYVSSFAISKEASEEPLSKTEFVWWVDEGARCIHWGLPADMRNTSFVASFVASFAISKEASEEPLSKTEFVWWVDEGARCIHWGLPADMRNASFVASFVSNFVSILVPNFVPSFVSIFVISKKASEEPL